MTTLTALEIANLILYYKDTKNITHRKLQKLLYYCQSSYLQSSGEPLFKDTIEAWDFGPVCPNVYHKFKQFGYEPLPRVEIDKSLYDINITNTVLSILTLFGNLSQEKLIDMSHIDAPWAKLYIPSLNQILSIEVIKRYFSNFSDMANYKNYINEKIEYSILIESSKSYLQSLLSLGDNWISPKSFSPNKESIKLASEILTTSKDIISMNPDIKVPKLILGPIASGGICIEFDKNNGKKLFINIYNNDLIEIDLEENGFFNEYEVRYNNGKDEFEKYFKKFI